MLKLLFKLIGKGGGGVSTWTMAALILGTIGWTFTVPRPATSADATAVQAIASLADPAKLATLKSRGANPRVQKITYWLATARAKGSKPETVADAALKSIRWHGTAKGRLTKESMLRNLKIAESLGCLDASGLADMKRGQAPTVRKGPYVNDQLSVDHIIPRAVVPELDNVLANLELMPLRMNKAKSAKIGQRQRDTARKFLAAGLITEAQAARVK